MASIVKKLLIANRGEIALRVVRTAKEMGISTVAVYSEQDRNSRYVDMADEAYLLSGDTYKDTYLNEDLLIDILHKTGADAVHPGYGFLSEVPSFAQKVEDAALERERKIQAATLAIKKKYGKNAILKGMNFEEGATAKDRNAQIGGHKA